MALKLDNNTLINRISGPISMYYLKPDPSVFVKYNKTINFPIILGFGDYHFSYQNLCKNCNKKDCVNIYDKNFLKKIDKLASEYPIDFFTESSDSSTEILEGQGILFDYFLRKVVCPCHKTELKEKNIKKYLKSCPTKNIRWHYTDTRFFYNKLEGFIFTPQLDYLNKVMFDIKNGRPIEPNYFGKVVRGSSYEEIFHITQSYFEDIKNKTNNAKTLLELGQNFTYELLSKLFDLLKKTPGIEYIIKQLSKFFVKSYFTYINTVKRNSALYKQLHSQNEDFNNDVSNGLINALSQDYGFINSIKSLFNFASPYGEYPENILYIEDIINMMNFKGDYSSIRLYNSVDKIPGIHHSTMIEGWKKILYYTSSDILNNILLHIGSVILDIYFVSRMLKQPLNNLNSSLSLCYFGNAHLTNSVYILTKVFNYKVIYSNDNMNYFSDKDNVKRCIEIEQFIDIPSDLKEHELLSNYQSKKPIYLDNLYKPMKRKSKSSRKSKRKTKSKSSRNSKRKSKRKSSTKSKRKSNAKR